MSGCRKQIILEITAPHKAVAVMGLDNNLLIKGNKYDIRKMPYLPNFSKSPAKIIDPATGASTWALGSHRCRVYKGIFAKNAVILINHHR